MTLVLVRPCRRHLYSTGCSQGMAKGTLGTAINFCDFSKAAGWHGISMILTFCSWDPEWYFTKTTTKIIVKVIQ